MPTVADIIDRLETLAPTRTAADWDNVGLLLGDRTTEVDRLMTCLTVTPETAGEAITRQAKLIVSHHPVLFRAVKRLSADTQEGRMLLGLVRAGIAVYSPHTALDNAPGGINDQLAGMLGLQQVRPLRKTTGGTAKQVKLVCFVPESDLTRVSDALFSAGAGRIGEYSECGFRLPGTGTFRGSEATNPTVGQKGRREEVAEYRLEVVTPEAHLGDVVAALRQAHSYEEPAFDIYPLTAPPGGGGEGRWGVLPQSETLGKVAATLRQSLNCGPVQVVGSLAAAVYRVAIVCGAGGELLSDAVRSRADVFVTGEMRYHDYLRAASAGIGLILPGHHATERCGVENLAVRLQSTFPQLEIWASNEEKDPVNWL